MAPYSTLAQEQANEIAGRKSTITLAQPPRTASIGTFRDAQLVHNQLQAARPDNRSTLTRNFQAVFGGAGLKAALPSRYRCKNRDSLSYREASAAMYTPSSERIRTGPCRNDSG